MTPSDVITSSTRGAHASGLAPSVGPSVDDPRVVQAAEEYTALLKDGLRPDRDEFLARHPDIADALARCLDGLEFIHAAGGSLSHSANRLAAHDPLMAGLPLGDFQLIRELGRGGMAIVYEADQLSLNRRVALKVLPFAATMDPRHLQRFKNEALAAASLRHEHIVHVYGVGCERGVHYYAMQLIEGQTLAQCKEVDHDGTTDTTRKPELTKGVSSLCSLSRRGKNRIRTIAQLIADAADALEYAHSMGVVHRDIKPGNLMLDNGGHLWITDFGLAKSLGPGRQPGGELTLTGDFIGTLRYMSPEQALAKHGLVDHRTDIYSLGATLYEMLTLRPAVDGTEKHELFRKIDSEEPMPLRKFDKSIPAELETITLKCLAKVPGERYASAKEMADDLRRWLGDHAIKAKPPTLLDRVGKWAGRHRGGIAAAVTMLVLATAGLAVSLAFLAKKESETSKANANAQRRLEQLEKANDLLGSVFEKLDPRIEEKGGPNLSEQLKTEVRRAIQELDGEAVGDDLTVAKLQDTLGRSLMGLGAPGEAVTLLEKAVATRQRLLGIEHEDTLNSLGSLATAFLDDGRFAEAIRLGEFTRDAQVAKLGPDHPDTLTTRNDLGMAYLLSGKVPEAIRLFEQLRQAQLVKLGANHQETLTTLNNLASAYQESGNLPEAIRLYEQARDAEVAVLGPDHPATLSTLNNLATALQAAGKLPEALRLFEQVRDGKAAKLGANHPATLNTLNNLAGAYQDSGRLPEAIRIYEKVRDAQVAKLGADHPNTLTTLNNLAGAFQDAGKVPEAILLYEQVRDAIVPKLGADHPDTLKMLDNLAQAYQAGDKLPEAIRLFEQVRDTLVSKLGADHPDTLIMFENLAGALIQAQRYSDAEQVLRTCLAHREKKGRNEWTTHAMRFDLGIAILGQKRDKEAESILMQGFKEFEPHAAKLDAKGKKYLAGMSERVVRLYDEMGQKDKADEWRKKLSDWQSVNPTNNAVK